MDWLYNFLVNATQGNSDPAAWVTCIVTGVIITTIVKAFAKLFD